MATVNPMEPKYLLTRTDAYGRAVANADIGETPEQSAAMIREDLKSSIDTVNEMIPYLVPPGVIVAWWGALDAIPSGWAFCDGTNGTPDLRGRFIFGGVSPGATGGSADAFLPRHSHSYWLKAPWPVAEFCEDGNKQIAIPGAVESFENGTTGAAGGDGSGKNLPPYMVLGYIMKLG